MGLDGWKPNLSGGPSILYRLTPSSVIFPDGTIVSTGHPIAYALEELPWGCQVNLDAGDYPAPGMVKRARPAALMGPEQGVATILPGSDDTIYFTDPEQCHHITFIKLRIMGSPRSAFMTLTNAHLHGFKNLDYEDIWFRWCDVDGGWDHGSRTGMSSKWGFQLHRVSGFVFTGGSVSRVRWEHLFYFHNSGPKQNTIEAATLGDCGRCVVMQAGRMEENDGQPCDGPLVLKDITAYNAGLTDGGSAFTISGQQGRLTMDVVKYGFNSPHGTGTGALVLWPEFDPENDRVGSPNGDVMIAGCHFEMGKDKGDRPLCKASAVERLVVDGSTFVTGQHPVAWDINPVGPQEGGMGSAVFPVKHVVKPEKPNTIKGKVRIGGMVWEA